MCLGYVGRVFQYHSEQIDSLPQCFVYWNTLCFKSHCFDILCRFGYLSTKSKSPIGSFTSLQGFLSSEIFHPPFAVGMVHCQHQEIAETKLISRKPLINTKLMSLATCSTNGSKSE